MRGCSRGPCKELGIHFLRKGKQAKQGTYIMAILGTGLLNNYPLNPQPCTLNTKPHVFHSDEAWAADPHVHIRSDTRTAYLQIPPLEIQSESSQKRQQTAASTKEVNSCWQYYPNLGAQALIRLTSRIRPNCGRYPGSSSVQGAFASLPACHP